MKHFDNLLTDDFTLAYTNQAGVTDFQDDEPGEAGEATATSWPDAEPVPVQLEWVPFDGTIPKGKFLASIRYHGYGGGIKFRTQLLHGQLKRAYDYKTNDRINFGEGLTMTHYMPLPEPVVPEHYQ